MILDPTIFTKDILINPSLYCPVILIIVKSAVFLRKRLDFALRRGTVFIETKESSPLICSKTGLLKIAWHKIKVLPALAS